MLRKIKREIAKGRMRDMGLDHINLRMHIRKNDTLVKECVLALQKTKNGRRRLINIYAKNPPLWKRIIEGDLKKDGDKAFARASLERGGDPYGRKAHKKSKRILRKISTNEA